MGLPSTLGLGAAAWALGICGFLGLLAICVTCVVLVHADRKRGAANLKAFAEVIKSFRKQPTAVPLVSPRGSAEASLDEAA